MLLLRAVFAGALIVLGMRYLRDPDLNPGSAALGVVWLAAGALLLVGFGTPIVGVVVAIAGIGVLSSLLPACTPTLFNSGALLIFASSILIAIIILGPGAFSVDARLFGRREIIIPRKSDS